MTYTESRFEGLLADACLRHRMGNPYANAMLDADGQHRLQAYLRAVKTANIYKATSESSQAQYTDLWDAVLRKLKVWHSLARLEEAAAIGHESFAKALAEIDWDNRPATDFVRAIDLALKVGAHLAARNLAAESAELHFDSEELQKYARILAPPEISRTPIQRRVNVRANVEWLKANKDQYIGKWVAIKDGTLIGSADSHERLIEEIGQTKGKGILVTNLY